LQPFAGPMLMTAPGGAAAAFRRQDRCHQRQTRCGYARHWLRSLPVGPAQPATWGMPVETRHFVFDQFHRT